MICLEEHLALIWRLNHQAVGFLQSFRREWGDLGQSGSSEDRGMKEDWGDALEPESRGLVKGLDAKARKRVRDIPGRRKDTPIE